MKYFSLQSFKKEKYDIIALILDFGVSVLNILLVVMIYVFK